MLLIIEVANAIECAYAATLPLLCRFNSIGEHGGRYSFQKPTNEGPIYLYYDQSSDNWCVGDQIGSQSSADLPQHSPKSRPHSSSGLNGAAFHCRHRPWIGEYRFCA